MPQPAELRLLACDGQVLVTHGRALVYRYEADDTGMRNLAIVALTDAVWYCIHSSDVDDFDELVVTPDHEAIAQMAERLKGK